MIQNFMKVYMYELEKFLLSKKEDISKISLWSDEANTDRPIKEYLKGLIESKFFGIPKDSSIENIKVNGEGIIVNNLNHIKINRVLLPEEITEGVKKLIYTNKTSVFTNPDILFEIIDDEKIFYEPVEIKTTKSDSIPGSSVQQIVPDEWVIFIRFIKSDIEITTGQYIYSINTKLQFPDRSPRPQVSFSELRNWNYNNRISKNNCLVYTLCDEDLLKLELLKDWQGVLADRWIEIIFEIDNIKTNEPWFNNNLRKFIVKFLGKYDLLSDDEKRSLKDKLINLIK